MIRVRFVTLSVFASRATILLALAGVAALTAGCGDESDSHSSTQTTPASVQETPESGSLLKTARVLRGAGGALDFEPLQQRHPALPSALHEALLAGVGRLVDVRQGLRVDFGGGLEFQYALLVIEPTRFAKGSSESLGPSGLIFVPFPFAADDSVLADAQASLQNAPEEVAYFLEEPHIPELKQSPESVVDEFAGRAPSDPLFSAVHPGLVLVLDEQADLASQLILSDPIKQSEGNEDVLEQLGTSINEFARK